MHPTLKLLVFDLDGTLVDSQIDLANSVNATLAHYNRPPLDQATIATYIGDGVTALVERSLNHAACSGAQPPLDEATAWFIAWYRIHKLDHTTVYPGVLSSLHHIRSSSPTIALAVLTNKPVAPSIAICEHFFPGIFQTIYGGNSFPTKKPDPQGLLTLLRESGVQAADTVMVGDSHVDIETARAAGTRSLGCAYGLSPQSLAAARPDQTVSTAADWPTALGL